MPKIRNLRVQPVSMIDRENRQAIEVYTETDACFHAILNVSDAANGELLHEYDVGLHSGTGHARVMLPRPEKSRRVIWKFVSRETGETLDETEGIWELPREWEFYVMISSHTDIGLHNSQYIQRYNSSQFLKKAMKLCDETSGSPDHYRYTMEGTWFWNNYPADHGVRAAKKVVRDYIQKGDIGICGGIAGNHTQVYGMEELCRSTYEKSRLKSRWGIEAETVSMIDNNGINWAVIQPLAEAGYKNIIFAPNQWNPLPSTVFKRDERPSNYAWNPQTRGGGARIDISFDSSLPMIFYWQSADESARILVYSAGQYTSAMQYFGLNNAGNNLEGWTNSTERMADTMAEHLPRVEERYPYSLWMAPSYSDDQEPGLNQLEAMNAWNARWKWPHFQTLGHPDAMLAEFRARYDGQIPTLRGDITGGWYQHPVSAPDLLADKFEADRLLPTAEKFSSIAALIDEKYLYPATAFERAWNELLFNDEHSYGTSGYQGRRVYETWMQHRAWIERGMNTARDESDRAMRCIASHVASDGDNAVVFNPTMQERTQMVESPTNPAKSALVTVPAFGYTTVPLTDFGEDTPVCTKTDTPPTVENRYYRIIFAEDGGMKSIFDKELCRELLDQSNRYTGNSFVYTNDNHRTFHTPTKASFTVEESEYSIRVTARMEEKQSGAAVFQTVTLPAYEKRIEIDNHLEHVRDMFNDNRYYRYAYYAFPFALDNAQRLCHLGGCMAEYAKDITGHGTDVYMAANEFCCVQNGKMGIGLMQLDSELVEFDHIHPDKTDFANTGDGAQTFVYLANDWLQMHVAGGSQMNFRFRYAITSFAGDYRSAGLPQMAERFANPVLTASIGAQKGNLPETCSFMKGQARLVDLKRAEDGKGLIARLYGAKDNRLTLNPQIFGEAEVVRNTVDERPMEDVGCLRRTGGSTQSTDGRLPAFRTLRIGSTKLKVCKDEPELPTGAVYTGLIDRPRAARGEREGHLYLLWGRCKGRNFSHYELFRGMTPDFTADEQSLIACVKQEKYVVGRYVDDGLEPNTRYYYRVRTVNRDGSKGKLSEVFSALTKE